VGRDIAQRRGGVDDCFLSRRLAADATRQIGNADAPEVAASDAKPD